MTTDKIMPHNIDAEAQVLSAIMHTPDSIFIADEYLSSDDFYSDKHKFIFSAFKSCYINHETVDLVVISEHLRNSGELEKAGGMGYLLKIASDGYTAANIKYHANIVKDKAILRRAIRWAHDIKQSAHGEVESVKEWLSVAESGLLDLSDTVKEKSNPHIADILLSIRQEHEKLNSGDIRPIACPLFDGVNGSDAAIPGIFPKHLWIIAGYTSVGKSTFLAQLLCDAGKDGARMLVFSCEDSRNMKAIKMLSNISDVAQKKIITGHSGGYESRIRTAEDVLRSWDTVIYDDVYNIDEIIMKSKKHKIKNGINLIALDFVQNLQGPGSLYERMSDAAIKLQKLAKDLDVAVLVLSQVSNDSVRDDSEIIGVKGAGELAAAADIVLWLKRDKDSERGLNCEIKKNRPFGETGIRKLEFSEFYTKIQRRLF